MRNKFNRRYKRRRVTCLQIRNNKNYRKINSCSRKNRDQINHKNKVNFILSIYRLVYITIWLIYKVIQLIS